jgi:hypothetical protein
MIAKGAWLGSGNARKGYVRAKTHCALRNQPTLHPAESSARDQKMKRPTKAEIEAAKTPRGGWTREQLAKWGVPWPPPRGWKAKLLMVRGQTRRHAGR